MTKEERNKRLNEIMAIYTKEDISLQALSDRFEISYQCISKFLKNNGIEIKKVQNQKSFLEQAVDALKNKSLKEVSPEQSRIEHIHCANSPSGLKEKW